MLRKFHAARTVHGFTLIELMSVVAIVGIIAIVGIPSYQSQVRKANRAEAKTALATGAQGLERCFTTFTTYSNSNCPTAASLADLGNNVFTYTMTKTPTAYSITATAGTNQANDTDCVKFIINNLGLKTSKNSGGTATTNCW